MSAAQARQPSFPVAGKPGHEADPPSLRFGEQHAFGQLSVRPLGVWWCPLSYETGGMFGGRVRKHDGPVLALAIRVGNRSKGQVFSPAPAFSDPWDFGSVTDNYGNRNLISGVCQFDDWPAWGQVGKKREKLRPGKGAVLVFVADELDNPDAHAFTWQLELRTDNEHATRKLRVMVPRNAIQRRGPRAPGK